MRPRVRASPSPLALLLLLFGSLVAVATDRFEVFWNVPSEQCYKKNFTNNIADYGIRVNTNQSFYGEHVVLFYEYKFGLMPYYNNTNVSDPIHGGIPQKLNLTAHLEKAREDIERAIPKESFDGLAVLDFEEWRPVWKLNWGKKTVYAKESIKYVQERFPELNYKAAKRKARQEFNEAAKRLFTESIRLGKEMRPFARWGFYGYPMCNYDAGKTSKHCSTNYSRHNKDLLFLFEESNALFPSIYLYDNESEINVRYVRAVLRETRRVAKWFYPRKPFYPYSMFENDPYQQPDLFYNDEDLCASLKQSADMGSSGVVLWSTSKNMKSRCEKIDNYVNEKLGSVIKTLRRRMNRCSEKRCSSRGACVLSTVSKECRLPMRLSDYACECDEPFHGPSCAQHQVQVWWSDY